MTKIVTRATQTLGVFLPFKNYLLMKRANLSSRFPKEGNTKGLICETIIRTSQTLGVFSSVKLYLLMKWTDLSSRFPKEENPKGLNRAKIQLKIDTKKIRVLRLTAMPLPPAPCPLPPAACPNLQSPISFL